jgi:hypothetical protein
MRSGSTDQIADRIEDAAEHIERYGWYQRGYAPGGRYDGERIDGKPVCILGGLLAVDLAWSAKIGAWHEAHEDGDPVGVDAVEQVTWTLQQRRPTHGGTLAHWNDAAGRTRQEVLDLLHRAAKDVRHANEIQEGMTT